MRHSILRTLQFLKTHSYLSVAIQGIISPFTQSFLGSPLALFCSDLPSSPIIPIFITCLCLTACYHFCYYFPNLNTIITCLDHCKSLLTITWKLEVYSLDLYIWHPWSLKIHSPWFSYFKMIISKAVSVSV